MTAPTLTAFAAPAGGWAPTLTAFAAPEGGVSLPWDGPAGG